MYLVRYRGESWITNLRGEDRATTCGRSWGLGGGVVEAVAELGEEVGWDLSLDHLADEPRERCGDGDQDPEKHGEEQACDSDSLKGYSNDVGLMERQRYVQGSDVGYEFYAVDDHGGEQESQDGEGADAEQEDVDGAGEALAAAAMGAREEMSIVISAHGGREAGDVEAPAGQNASNDGIDAGVSATVIGASPLRPDSPVRLRGWKW
jgi:hypothetical protein